MATIYDMPISVREWPLVMLLWVFGILLFGIGLGWLDHWLRKKSNDKHKWWRR